MNIGNYVGLRERFGRRHAPIDQELGLERDAHPLCHPRRGPHPEVREREQKSPARQPPPAEHARQNRRGYQRHAESRGTDEIANDFV